MDEGYGRWSTFSRAIFELLFDLAYFVNAKWALITLPKTPGISGCQLPPGRSRRLEFTSGLHRNSAYLERRAALASLSDASGMSDKHPVLPQSCRSKSVLMVTFLAADERL